MVRDYTPEFEKEVKHWVRDREAKKRYAHTKRVVATATTLAKEWAPEDVMVCRLASWIHDAAKHYSDALLLRTALEAGVSVSEFEWRTPMLLHGIVAYVEADREFQLNDERIRTACAYHTTGSPDMNLVDKLVYLADLIEPERDFPSVEILRAGAMENIDATILVSIDNTIRYLLDKNRPIDPRVVDLYNHLTREYGG